jgi:pimeloyl-ACP methyl ester carboxylesterase
MRRLALLKERYRCVAFDFRGQGRSEVTRSGYDMETLYEDAVALIEQLDCAPCHFLGLSMGGFIGLRLAARRPELLRSLMLLETTADPEPSENVAKYKQLTFVARWFGLGLVVDRVMPIMFGRTFLADPARRGAPRVATPYERKPSTRHYTGHHWRHHPQRHSRRDRQHPGSDSHPGRRRGCRCSSGPLPAPA